MPARALRTGTGGALSAAERHWRIAESGYLRAAASGFAGDRALDGWLAAEQEVDARTAGPGASDAPRQIFDAKR
jgi:hypothetical protein